MTIEEKARAYDYSKARMIKACDEHRCSLYFMNEIFPEPKVLKDEEMKLTIIQFLEYASSYGCPDILSKKKAKTWIAWLEKQDKENIIESLRLEYERGKADALQEQRKEWTAEDLLNRNQIADILQEYNRGDLIKWLEKQGESKFGQCIQEGDEITSNEDGTHFNISQLERVAKKEPKLKVGQWIIDTQDGAILHINKVHEYAYEVTNLKGGVYQISRCSIETSYKPWTIQDAKDGDVLKEDSCTFIVERMKTDGTAITYCCLFDDGEFDSSFTLCFDVDSTYPATKEQRNLLFQKMKEAGYEWDAEKKELKKVEQKPVWSVDDENRFNNLVYLVEHSDEGKATKEGFIKFINSLKTLKDRVQPQWRPSSQHIAALEYQVNSTYEGSWQYKASKELLEQLKKL